MNLQSRTVRRSIQGGFLGRASMNSNVSYNGVRVVRSGGVPGTCVEICSAAGDGMLRFSCRKSDEPPIHSYLREARSLVHRLCGGDSWGQHPRQDTLGGPGKPQRSVRINPGRESAPCSKKPLGHDQARAHHYRSLSGAK